MLIPAVFLWERGGLSSFATDISVKWASLEKDVEPKHGNNIMTSSKVEIEAH